MTSVREGMKITMFNTFAAIVPSEAVQISIISAFGGIAVAYITNVVSKRVQERKAQAEPKDRVELLFERYEIALKQKDEDNDELRVMLRDAQAKLAEADKKLNHSYYENSRLKGELERLKAQYHAHKNDPAE